MANKTINMDLLKKNAVHIYPGMTSVFPSIAREKTLNLSYVEAKFEGCYSTHCPTICFICDGELYATPYSELVVRSLKAEGFKEEEFYVPFSQGDYPKEDVAKWVYLKEMVIQSYIDDFIEDCTTYSNEHDIGTLSNEVFENCMEIPFMGLPVVGIGYETCCYPILNIGRMEQEKGNYLGRYHGHNNVVVFVYRDGKTYVTKGYRIVHELKKAGYTDKNMLVPLSDGETIKDKALQNKWKSIKVR